MKLALMILVFAMGLPWCGCSSTGDSASPVDIPSTLFIAEHDKAVKGDAVAQFTLGERYRKGEKVKRNTAQAYAWFTISARNGHRLAKARIRAGWDRATIARGKDLAVILIERHPNAVFVP